MSRTLTSPPTDRSMWRRLLAVVHPDRGGDHNLFIWTQALYEHVRGDHLEDVRSGYQHHEPPPHSTTGERIDYSAAYGLGSFEDLTRQAVAMASEVGEPYASLLRMLGSCYPVSAADTHLYRAQHQGATYKQLAYIAHLAGMDSAQRREWYRIAERVPLSARHAGHIIKELQARRGYAA